MSTVVSLRITDMSLHEQYGTVCSHPVVLRCYSLCLQPSVDYLLDHPLYPLHAAENILPKTVDFNVDLVAHLFLRQRQLRLRVRNEHDSEGLLLVVHLGDGEGCAVDCHIALLDDIWHGRCGGKAEGIPDRVAIWLLGQDRCGGIDVPLVGFRGLQCSGGSLTWTI